MASSKASTKRISSSGRKYVAAVDFGTTSVRCFLYDQQGRIRSTAAQKITQRYPHQGWNEVDPEEAWTKLKGVFKTALENVGAQPSDVKSFALATQRGSFLTWDKRTGKPFHNIITWKDLRADHLVKTWNNSWFLFGLHIGSAVIHTLTRNKRYLATTSFKFMNSMLIIRLAWALQNYEHLRKAADEGNALLGTLDTFLLHRLTRGRLHATDFSNVCATGLFDPYMLQYSDLLMGILNIPKNMMPEIKDTCGDWGSIHSSVFGAEIPIHCVISDQGASLFGSFCFNPGDARLTMGTGSFLAFNTGTKPHASIAGIVPIIAWKIGEEIVYTAEGQAQDTATIIDWCRKIDLFEDYNDIEQIITSIPNTDDLYFVPAFSGIQAPVNDECVAAGYIGIKPSTTKAHLLRAAMESLAFRIYQICQVMYEETGKAAEEIRVDGGVSQNDFLMQLIADLTMATIERPTCIETTVQGAAMLAGIQAGIWKSREELRFMRKVERIFKPVENRWLDYAPLFSSWKNAVKRLGQWY